MALPKIIFTIGNGNLGRLGSEVRKTPSLILTGNTVSDGVQLGKAYQIFSLQDAIDLGIKKDGDNAFAYKHILQFYSQVGNGSLWFMLVSDGTSLTEMADVNGEYAPTLIGAAKGSIRVLGLVKKPTEEPTISEGMDADVKAGVVKLQALAEHFAERYMPFRAIVSANNFSSTPSELFDFNTANYNRVAVLLSNTDGEKDAAIGLALGRLASIPVQRNIGRVKDGAVEQIAAYMTDGKPVSDYTNAWEAIHNKGYIFLRSFAGRAGFYFSDDPTATKEQDDFKPLANGFVMDKAILIAYNALIDELSDDILLSDDGTIHPAIIKSWQNKIENQIDGAMTDNGEISGVKVFIDHNQDILSKGKMEVSISLLPVGYAKRIEVLIGFTTKLED